MKTSDAAETEDCFRKMEETDKVEEKMGRCGERLECLRSWSSGDVTVINDEIWSNVCLGNAAEKGV